MRWQSSIYLTLNGLIKLKKFDEIKYNKFKVIPILTRPGRVEAFLKFLCHLERKRLLSRTYRL